MVHLLSQYGAPAFTLPTRRRRRLHGRLAEILKRRPQQLPGHRRALDVPVRPQLLRQLVRLLRVDDAVGVVLRPKIALQPDDDDGQVVDAVE